MDWTATVDAYCERLDPGFWAEPVNAVTNAAFLIAAVIMWRRGAGTPYARLLAAILFAIGIGSGLFHTFATRWAALADVVPIALFILTYVHAANRSVLRLSPLLAGIGTAAFVPYAAVTGPVFDALPFFTVSSFYWPVPLLILLYAAYLRRREPGVARGFAVGAGILIASLTFRSLDMTVCPRLALGTHFMWHVLNGIMLGWMIEVLVRHRLAGQGERR